MGVPNGCKTGDEFIFLENVHVDILGAYTWFGVVANGKPVDLQFCGVPRMFFVSCDVHHLLEGDNMGKGQLERALGEVVTPVACLKPHGFLAISEQEVVLADIMPVVSPD